MESRYSKCEAYCAHRLWRVCCFCIGSLNFVRTNAVQCMEKIKLLLYFYLVRICSIKGRNLFPKLQSFSTTVQTIRIHLVVMIAGKTSKQFSVSFVFFVLCLSEIMHVHSISGFYPRFSTVRKFA